jgi:hypothetical protein
MARFDNSKSLPTNSLTNRAISQVRASGGPLTRPAILAVKRAIRATPPSPDCTYCATKDGSMPLICQHDNPTECPSCFRPC